jgi:hypothetical protein
LRREWEALPFPPSLRWPYRSEKLDLLVTAVASVAFDPEGDDHMPEEVWKADIAWRWRSVLFFSVALRDPCELVIHRLVLLLNYRGGEHCPREASCRVLIN